MSKLSLPVLLLVLAGFATGCSTLDRAAEPGGSVEVTYQQPDRFTDMSRTFPGSQGADEGYLEELRNHVVRTGASRLPAGYTAFLTITDVDMAGDFEPHRGANFTDIRIVKPIYPPRMRLSYRLVGPDGTVAAQGEKYLSDPSFDWRIDTINRDDPLRHEKRLLEDFVQDLARGL